MSPRIAIFYDWLNQWGGAEKVLLDIISIYPDAPIFTIVYDQAKTPWLPPSTQVIPSMLNKLPFSSHNPIIYTPFYSLILEQFDFSQYDIVISTTSTIGHCLLTSPNTLHICYFHNINRYLYQTPKSFKLLNPLLNLYKDIDKIHSNRPDQILCNSLTVKQRIAKIYQKNAIIIHPGIDVEFFKPTSNPSKSYYLIVNRLVPHKNTDKIIAAFNKLPYKLLIVGTGRYQNHLHQLAKHNPQIEFLGNVDDKKLRDLYQNCRALICPQVEDFGLTPIEAQACGRPVIALGIGGNTETIINGTTGLFFENASSSSFINCLHKFNKIKFSSQVCRQNSLKFSNILFMLNFKKAIDNLWQKHLTTTF